MNRQISLGNYIYLPAISSEVQFHMLPLGWGTGSYSLDINVHCVNRCHSFLSWAILPVKFLISSTLPWLQKLMFSRCKLGSWWCFLCCVVFQGAVCSQIRCTWGAGMKELMYPWNTEFSTDWSGIWQNLAKEVQIPKCKVSSLKMELQSQKGKKSHLQVDEWEITSE